MVAALSRCVIWHMPLADLHAVLADFPCDAAVFSHMERNFFFRRPKVAPGGGALVSQNTGPTEDYENGADDIKDLKQRRRTMRMRILSSRTKNVASNFLEMIKSCISKQELLNAMDNSIREHLAKAFELRILWPGLDYSHLMKDLQLFVVLRHSVHGVDDKGKSLGIWRESACFGTLSLDPVQTDLSILPHVPMSEEPALVAVLHQNVFMSWLHVWSHTSHVEDKNLLFELQRRFFINFLQNSLKNMKFRPKFQVFFTRNFNSKT